MASRIWNGVISFGLVNIPVGLSPAIQENKVSFNQLHKSDLGRIQYKKVCSKCEHEVDSSDIVKGIPFEKGQYATFTDDEIKAAQGKKSEAIEIKAFVDLAEIDPIFFDKPYYLTPGKHGDKPYALLREALAKSNKAGIATFALRNKEALAAVRVQGNALVLNTLHFADEIREAESTPSGEVDKMELNMAIQLVNAMEKHFDPTQYSNTYAQTIKELTQKKITGQPVERRSAPVATNVIDLMQKLKQSLETQAAANDSSKKATRKASSKKAPVRKAAPKEHLKMVA